MLSCWKIIRLLPLLGSLLQLGCKSEIRATTMKLAANADASQSLGNESSAQNNQPKSESVAESIQGAVISVEPGTMAIGSPAGTSLQLQSGRSTDVQFTFTQSGPGKITDIAAVLSAADSVEWKGGNYPGEGGSCGTTLEIGKSCTLVVTANVSRSGVHSTLIRALYNSAGKQMESEIPVTFNTLGGGADTSYGVNGTAAYLVNSSTASVGGADLDTAGRLVIGGHSAATSGSNGDDFTAVRFTANGVADSTFGNAGLYLSNNTVLNEKIIDVKIAPSGAIFMGAYQAGTNWKFINLALNTNGSLMRNTIIAATSRAYAVDWHASEKTVLAGRTESGAPQKLLVRRMLADGTADPAFGTAGVVSNPFGSATASRGDSVHIVRNQNEMNDQIYVAGSFNTGSNDDIAVIRLTYSGALDTTFNGTGIVTLDHLSASRNEFINIVKTDSVGRVLLGGYVTDASGFKKFAVIRLTAAGILDTTFATGGYALLGLAGDTMVYSLLVDQQNGIVAAGSRTDGSVTSCLVARFTQNGQTDNSFGGTGYVEPSFAGASTVSCREVLQQADGRLVLAASGVPASSTLTHFLATRLSP